MTKRRATYNVLSDTEELEERFYHRYDSHALLNKVLALEHIVSREDSFKEEIAARETISHYVIDSRYFDSIRAEIYLTEYHQFEAFFALLLAPFQEVPTWIYLTEYAPGDIAAAARKYLAGEIPSITADLFQHKSEFLRTALYALFEPAQQELKDRWNENLENASWLLDRMAKRYIEGLGEYNSYKHGLRVLTGPSTFSFGVEKVPGVPAEVMVDRFHSSDSLTFLEVKKLPTGSKEVFEVTKHFHPGSSIFFISKMAQMAETIRRTRLHFFTGQPVDELHTFLTLDRGRVTAMEDEGKFRFQIQV